MKLPYWHNLTDPNESNQKKNPQILNVDFNTKRVDNFICYEPEVQVIGGDRESYLRLQPYTQSWHNS